MTDDGDGEELDIERQAHQRRARRTILAIALGFYLLLFAMCAVVLVIVLAARR